MLKREKIYYDEIVPLLKEIYNICVKNDIQMISSFNLGKVEDGDMISNTYVNSNENADSIVDALKILSSDYIAVPNNLDDLMYEMLREEISDNLQ